MLLCEVCVYPAHIKKDSSLNQITKSKNRITLIQGCYHMITALLFLEYLGSS